MSIEWSKIRPWNGSQNQGFEELCCQLAEHEAVPAGSRFVRKGAPDAGVECFWMLPSGEDRGWQAKFFPDGLDDSQWSQLDSSVEKALEKHPKLTKYVICLPYNLPDARIPDQKSALEHWNKHVTKWESWASSRGMQTEFTLWGESAILSRLAAEEHRGRYLFWFNQELFSTEWFRTQLNSAIANAGPRYTPELNVDLPISKVLEGLGRTSKFYERFRILYGNLRKRGLYCSRNELPTRFRESFDRLQSALENLLRALSDIKEPRHDGIPFDALMIKTSDCNDRVRGCLADLDEYAKTEEKEEIQKEKAPNGLKYRKRSGDYRNDLYRLLEITRELEFHCQSSAARVSNLAALLIVGEAGTGKTHLLLDVAEKRIAANLPAIVLLGEQFVNLEPWSQVLNFLGLRCSRDEFLGALDAAGAASGGRAVLAIDALNEGEGVHLWHKHPRGVLAETSRFKHVAVAITVRSSYESTVIPDGLIPNLLLRLVHAGFAEVEYLATRTFFDHFGIQHPSIPLLAPEFQNPLFLKTFCNALKNEGLTRIPPGFRGISQLLNFYLESVNKKLARPEHLDFDPQARPVQEAVIRLARAMADLGKAYLSRESAKILVDRLLPHSGYTRTLFRALISEGVLAEERAPVEGTSKRQDVVRFAYERFTDHLIAKFLLDSNLKSTDPSSDFAPNSPIGKVFDKPHSCWEKRGLLDALCIQVPERLSTELPDLLVHCADSQPMHSAFVQSLIWRDPKAISDATLAYVNRIVAEPGIHSQFLDALLTVAVYPDHPYNARFLHSHLMKFGMPERDAWWSIYLYSHFHEGGAIDRLVDWALSVESKAEVDDDSILLAAVPIAWFLTSSNRYLRDRSTKALVALLTPRIGLVKRLLQAFRNVNDPYVAERIYAVAYGCALRGTDQFEIAALAQRVYDFVFAAGDPIPHILLRDYARGVIECAFNAGSNLKLRKRDIRPPYKSSWPSRIPSTKHLEEKYGTWHEGMTDQARGRHQIYGSVMGGDFASYIIGTNSGRSEYSSRRLRGYGVPTYKDRYDAFVKSLTGSQKKVFRLYERKFREWQQRQFTIRIISYHKTDKTDGSALVKQLKRAPSLRTLKEKLTKKQYRIFSRYVHKYMSHSSIDVQRDRFDLRIAQRWILQRVFDLGWTEEKFGFFDQTLRSHGRDAHKSERIGKKYQWIAYHEFLARLTDNFAFRSDPWSRTPAPYHGPWQLYVRDIDPSIVISRTSSKQRDAWWAPVNYNKWRDNEDDRSWIADSGDSPDPKRLLIVSNPQDHSPWVTLEGWYHWSEPFPPEEERYELERREFWYQIRSYLVKRDDADALFDWARQQHFMGRWMPEGRELHRVFLGEFHWSPAYLFHNHPYFGYQSWTRGSSQSLPRPVHVTTERYLDESATQDCSVEDTIHIILPTKLISDSLRLKWNGIEGKYFDPSGQVAAFDPSVNEPGPNSLLIKQNMLQRLLDESEWDLIWTVLGERNLIGGNITHEGWKGRLELSGAFRYTKDGILGELKTKLNLPQ